MTATLALVATKKATPATHAQLAAMEFAAIKQFRGMSQIQRHKKAHAIVERVRPMMVLAVECVAMEKAELVERVIRAEVLRLAGKVQRPKPP
jgi:hypothetical protein